MAQFRNNLLVCQIKNCTQTSLLSKIGPSYEILWNADKFTPSITYKRIFSNQKQPWELAAAFGNAVVNAVLFWFYDSKQCCRKGFHRCGLSFQVLQYCWQFLKDLIQFTISLIILHSQYQCCLFPRFTTILAQNKGWSAANDHQFFHPPRLEGSSWLLTFQYWSYINNSLQTFIDKIMEIIYFSTVLFIFHPNIKWGTYLK